MEHQCINANALKTSYELLGIPRTELKSTGSCILFLLFVYNYLCAVQNLRFFKKTKKEKRKTNQKKNIEEI